MLNGRVLVVFAGTTQHEGVKNWAVMMENNMTVREGGRLYQ